MNQRIETAPATKPQAITDHEATLLDIAGRLQSLGASVVDAITMSPDDQGELFGRLLDQLNHEHMRLSTARTVAYELAAEESREASEREDALAFHVNDPRDSR